MAKKLSMMTIVVSLAFLLAVVYYLRPRTFDFLTQGFTGDEDFEDEEGFDGCPEGQRSDSDGNCVEGFADEEFEEEEGFKETIKRGLK